MPKICTRCKKEKSLNEFSFRKRKIKNGYVFKPLSCCKICNSEISKEYYYKEKELNLRFVYRFIDKNDNVIYIGKTEMLNQRISYHINGHGHLPKKCIEEITNIQYLVMSSTILMDIKEIYYINLYKPKYNSNYIANEPGFIIKEFNNDKWINYNRQEVKKIEKKDTTDDFINNPSLITSIFYRKRNGNFLVYLEYLEYSKSTKNTKKRQIPKGSFQNEDEAKKLVNNLKALYGKV